MDKAHIISEIQRTAAANGGVPLGWRRFETDTGIRYYDWYGQFWARWGDALQDAGFKPNQMIEAYSDEYLIQKVVLLTQRLKKVPAKGDIRLATKVDPSFPSDKAIRRLGLKHQLASRVISFCEAKAEYYDVLELWKQPATTKQPLNDAEDENTTSSVIGYVYLLKHGSRREYKIGQTNNPIRRAGELGIQLPEKLQPIHYIETDDPVGIEGYWHKRFAAKRKEGEWFALTTDDVRAFKRWRRIN